MSAGDLKPQPIKEVLLFRPKGTVFGSIYPSSDLAAIQSTVAGWQVCALMVQLQRNRLNQDWRQMITLMDIFDGPSFTF